MDNKRFVVSPFTYYGESSRPRTWSIWDREIRMWTGDYVGSKEKAAEVAERLNAECYH